MLPLIVPVVIGLTGVAAWKVHKKRTAPNPQQKMILDTALSSKLSSDDYNKLADAFDLQGLKAEATLLRNRAALQDAPPEKKLAWRMAFKKALAQEDPKLVLKMADAFAAQGATGAAADLRKYAQGLKDGTASPTPMTPTAVTGSGPSMIVSQPAPVAAPAANTTGTPTVTTTTGAVAAPSDATSSMSQGAPASTAPPDPTVSSVPVSGSQITPSPSDVVAAIAAASSAQGAAQAAIQAVTQTPTVSATTGAVAVPGDQTSPMSQGTPQ